MNSRNLQGTLNKPRVLSGNIVKNTGSGKDGITPHIGENGNWFIGEEDTGVRAIGMSAYEVACIAGFEGTEEEWLESLTGKSGVYVGEGEMPEGYNIQVIPSENSKEAATKEYVDNAIANLDIPIGGSTEWELIVDYTVPEGVKVDVLDFTKDISGNDFNLSQAIIFLVVKASETLNNREIYCTLAKGYTAGSWDGGIQIGNCMATASTKGAFATYIEAVGNTYMGFTTKPQNYTSLWGAQSTLRGLCSFRATTGMPYDQGNGGIERFRIRSLNSDFLGVDSSVKIWGVRK